VRVIRILIVDDIPLYRAGLRWVLERAGDCAIVGCATQVADILQLAQTQHPDVVLLHEGLAEGNALEIASLLLQQAEQRGLFVLASSGTEERVFQFFLAGAAAYESRWIAPGDLVEKVRRVSAGEYLISDASIRSGQREKMRPTPAATDGGQRRGKSSPPSGDCPLSNRELQMLERMAQGMSNKEIAFDLGISDQTVKNHITSLMKKLGVLDRTAAVMYALRCKWIALEEPVRRARPIPA
jgi:DNA-binding NarL/FixJ family response regulator